MVTFAFHSKCIKAKNAIKKKVGHLRHGRPNQVHQFADGTPKDSVGGSKGNRNSEVKVFSAANQRTGFPKPVEGRYVVPVEKEEPRTYEAGYPKGRRLDLVSFSATNDPSDDPTEIADNRNSNASLQIGGNSMVQL